MFVPRRSLNGLHLTTYICRREDECKQRRLASVEAREGVETDLTNYRKLLTKVSPFKNLGKVMSELDYN